MNEGIKIIFELHQKINGLIKKLLNERKGRRGFKGKENPNKTQKRRKLKEDSKIQRRFKEEDSKKLKKIEEKNLV